MARRGEAATEAEPAAEAEDSAWVLAGVFRRNEIRSTLTRTKRNNHCEELSMPAYTPGKVRLLICLVLAVFAGPPVQAADAPEWRSIVGKFAKDHFNNPAWGYSVDPACLRG